MILLHAFFNMHVLLPCVHLSEEEEKYVAEYQTDNTHCQTDLHHLVLLYQTGRVGDSIWRCRDRQSHCYRCCYSDTDKYGRCAADALKRVAHTLTYNGKDWHEECCRCGV